MLPAEVNEGDTRVSLKDWGRSSCWATKGILVFCGEREHEVSVYDLAVIGRPKLEAGMIHTFEKDCKNFERRKSQTTEVVTWTLPQPKLHLGPHSRLQPSILL